VDQSELLRRGVAVLERLSLPYYVTGSMASMRYGEARLTNDVDIVVELAPSAVHAFCASFPEEDFYVSEDAARAAAVNGGQFNVIWPEAGLKIDVIVVLPDDPKRSRFARARPLPIDGGGSAMFASPEDSIISKLDFHQLGESEKHLRDIASILKVRGDQLDLGSIDAWASDHGLTDVWNELRRRTGR
jgi:hypothetical protein